MPIALADFFINFLTDPKDIVLDPFGGSCTTGKSAELLKRKWICIEQNKEYLVGARGRFLNGLNTAK
jgi:site-specific DNA-methyltransferase (cytosine-N4-specific)